ncbi:hypothetical protein BHE74_00024371 [Ensete ventricosum]|nr:hypothetical protein BHE74_00024371 [Ensete ventricosum]RZR83361.1 hypothetical protein BHM03_00009959 [Ensete ventricosum]
MVVVLPATPFSCLKARNVVRVAAWHTITTVLPREQDQSTQKSKEEDNNKPNDSQKRPVRLFWEARRCRNASQIAIFTVSLAPKERGVSRRKERTAVDEREAEGKVIELQNNSTIQVQGNYCQPPHTVRNL